MCARASKICACAIVVSEPRKVMSSVVEELKKGSGLEGLYGSFRG